MRKIRKENLSFAVSLLALAIGIADAESILLNLKIDTIFIALADKLNLFTDCNFTKEQIFSYLYIILLFYIYKTYVNYEELYGIKEKNSDPEIEKKIYIFSKNPLEKIINKIRSILLNYSFKNNLLYYSSFKRDQLAGEIGPGGINIPPPETFECEDQIVRIQRIQNDGNLLNEEIRFSINKVVLKVRNYVEGKSDGFGEFNEEKFKIRKYYWLFFLEPLFLIKWILKNYKSKILIFLIIFICFILKN